MKRLTRGIIHYFLSFLAIASLVPFILATILLLNSVNQKISSQREHQLDTSQSLIQEEVQSSLERLLLSTEESALHLEHTLSKGTSPAFVNAYLKSFLTDSKVDKKLSFIRLYNGDGKPIISNGQTRPPDALTNDFKQHSSKSWSSLEWLPVDGKSENDLFLVASTPVKLNGDVPGALVLGKDAQSLLHRLQQVESISGLNLQVRKLNPSSVSVIQHEASINRENSDYRRLELVNRQGLPVAEIIVTMPMPKFSLLEEEALYIAIYCVCMVLTIALAGYWFYRYVIAPMQGLIRASRLVSEGNLQARIHYPNAKGEIQQTLTAFNRMVSQLESSQKSRDAFIASITHDLRTPLLAEKRVLELFQEFRSELPEQFSKLVENLKDSNLYLLDMINTLLEVYRYEAGKVPSHFEPVDMEGLLTEVFSQLQPLAEKKQIALKQEIEPPDWLVADRQKIKRMLINLISNAIENIPQGSQVTVTFSHPEPGLNQLLIADNGPGIPDEQMAGMFERFYTSANRAKKIGSGLGLFICKCIVDAHQGTITVSNGPNGGTHIVVTIQNGLL